MDKMEKAKAGIPTKTSIEIKPNDCGGRVARRNRAAYAEQLLQMLFGYLLKQFRKKAFLLRI